MSHRYYVVVCFEANGLPIVDPASYIESAIAEYRGCWNSNDPGFSIDPDSVKTADISGKPQNTFLGEIIRDMKEE